MTSRCSAPTTPRTSSAPCRRIPLAMSAAVRREASISGSPVVPPSRSSRGGFGTSPTPCDEDCDAASRRNLTRSSSVSTDRFCRFASASRSMRASASIRRSAATRSDITRRPMRAERSNSGVRMSQCHSVTVSSPSASPACSSERAVRAPRTAESLPASPTVTSVSTRPLAVRADGTLDPAAHRPVGCCRGHTRTAGEGRGSAPQNHPDAAKVERHRAGKAGRIRVARRQQQRRRALYALGLDRGP